MTPRELRIAKQFNPNFDPEVSDRVWAQLRADPNVPILNTDLNKMDLRPPELGGQRR